MSRGTRYGPTSEADTRDRLKIYSARFVFLCTLYVLCLLNDLKNYQVQMYVIYSNGSYPPKRYKPKCINGITIDTHKSYEQQIMDTGKL